MWYFYVCEYNLVNIDCFKIIKGDIQIINNMTDVKTELVQVSPDHDIEQFWLAFKQSMLNFYSAKHVMTRPIDYWSIKLNKLQTQHKYTEIEAHIKNYLSLYGLDVLRTESQYYINILITNLKRWDKIARSYKFFDAGNEKNLVIILLEIAYTLLKKNKTIQGLFIDVELYLLYEDFGKLLEYAIDNNAIGIIDKLMSYDAMNVLHKVNSIYGTSIEYKVAGLLSGKKIIKIINDHLHPGSVSP